MLAPRCDQGRHLAADLQVELLYLLHSVFGRGQFFTEETWGEKEENKNIQLPACGA